MNAFRLSLALTALVFAADVASAQGKSSVGQSDYYPLAIGSRWEYVTKIGAIVTEVTKHEEIGGVMCARVEAKLGNGKTSSEYIHIDKDGVYRYQASDQGISPALRFLSLPFKEGDSWKVESKTLGLTVKGTFSVTKGSITLGGVEYKDVLICNSDDFMISDKNVKHTYWFAKGVGIVKQTVTYGKHEMVLELKKYTPGSK